MNTQKLVISMPMPAEWDLLELEQIKGAFTRMLNLYRQGRAPVDPDSVEIYIGEFEIPTAPMADDDEAADNPTP